jgi:hypothetical protein
MEYFMVVWYFCGHLVYFPRFCNNKSGNPAPHPPSKMAEFLNGHDGD